MVGEALPPAGQRNWPSDAGGCAMAGRKAASATARAIQVGQRADISESGGGRTESGWLAFGDGLDQDLAREARPDHQLVATDA